MGNVGGFMFRANHMEQIQLQYGAKSGDVGSTYDYVLIRVADGCAL